MIYLFSQIAISLLLAAIVGVAAGWLTHRARADKKIRQLQQVIGRQQQHVNEAQTEVSILSGDFDDLKYRTDNQINELKSDNQKIPALNQNLEKSQLLVRQLMQKHAAELTELSEEKEKLIAKTKIANDREKELIKLQAELDIERRKTRKLDAVSDTVQDKPQDKAPADSGIQPQAELPLSVDDEHATDPETNSAANKKLPLSGNTQTTTPAGDAATIATAAIASAAMPSAAETEAELLALRAQLAEDVTVKSTRSEPADSQVDDSQLEPLFDAVDQHDDLKQIFGIGPVTEKTLNKLGITAYSQLAELKQHDIEKIANALQIIPSRIERDNWVGGARAQLEEVLEGL